MRGSLFPDGVNVDHAALRRTETTKAEEILRGRLDWTSRGMYTGGEITVNVAGAPPFLHIDVAQLSGFAPSGDFIETSSDYYDISLDDETNGVVNLVCAVYTESEIHRQPHETDGETWPTHAEGAWRIRVYSEASYAALPATDGNLASDARDRCLIVGKVTANGPAASLTASSIQGPATFSNILYANPRIPLTIPGVTISGVSPGTSTGLGTLDYTYAVGPVYGLQWTSFAGGAGAVVNPTVDGAIDVLDGTGEFLTLEIVISQLSTTTPISESIDIINMYEQDIPRLTGEDDLHRNMQGTGTPTPQNPHGNTLDDFGGSSFGLLEEHQDIMHANGIWNGSSPAIFSGSITFPVGGDLFSIMSPALSDLYYINGKKLNTLTPLSFQFIPTVIPSSAAGCHFYEIGADDDGAAYVTLKMSFPDPRTISGCWIVDASDEYPVGGGSANLALTTTNPGVLTYAFSWDGGETVTVIATQDPHIIRLFAANAKDWIDVYVNTISGEANPDANPPGVGVYSDAITIFASVDLSQNLPLANVCGWWDAFAAPARFAIGYAPYDITRSFVDKRIWGTLATENIADSALQELVYSSQDELHYSGILYSRSALHDNFEIYGVAALGIDIRGGAYYCRGERIEFDGSTVALVDNTVNLVYLDTAGAIQLLDVTADFVGSVADALEYLVGRSQLMPDGHDSQFPERGVALYVITTAGGAITLTQNLMRNVNGPVDPWSVATFTIYAQPVSAFNSLYSAFLYVGLDGGAHEIVLTGHSTVAEKIIQPAGINVRGLGNSSSVSITHVDITGAWELSTWCRVDNVAIYMQADAGAAIEVKDNCTISRCTYSTFAANADVFIISGLAVTNVVIEKNKGVTRSGAVVLTHANCTEIYIRDNIISHFVNNSGLGYGVVDVLGTDLHVTGNKITTNNATDFTPGINISGVASGMWIQDNHVSIGDGDGVSSELGIVLAAACTDVKIQGNTLDMVAATHELSIGISMASAQEVIVSDNNLDAMAVGISVDGAALHNVKVINNTLTGCFHRGIDFALPNNVTVHGACVEGNKIYSMVKGTGGLAAMGTTLYGIRVDVAPGVTSIAGFSISHNELYGLTNSTAGICYGIEFLYVANPADLTMLNGLVIDSNIVNGCSGKSGTTTIGLFQRVTNLDYSRGNSVSGNIVSAVYPDAVAAVVWGISTQLDDCRVVNNSVRAEGVATGSIGSGIRVSGANSIVSDNEVFANWVGIDCEGAGSIISNNQVEAYGIGILSDASVDDVSIHGNTVDVTTVNSVTNLVQPAASCAGVAANGSVSVLDNTVVISGSGAPINVPDYSAHIYVVSASSKIHGNSTSLGNIIAAVGGVSPPGSANPAYHIFFGSEDGCHSEISSNKLDNYTNASGGCLNGIYLAPAPGVSDPNIYLSADNNHIRGRSLVGSGANIVPCVVHALNYPYEYYNEHQSDTTVPNIAYVLSRGNTVTGENDLTKCPTIYFHYPAGVNTEPSQEPYDAATVGPPVNNNAGSTNNFATCYSPSLWW